MEHHNDKKVPSFYVEKTATLGDNSPSATSHKEREHNGLKRSFTPNFKPSSFYPDGRSLSKDDSLTIGDIESSKNGFSGWNSRRNLIPSDLGAIPELPITVLSTVNHNQGKDFIHSPTLSNVIESAKKGDTNLEVPMTKKPAVFMRTPTFNNIRQTAPPRFHHHIGDDHESDKADSKKDEPDVFVQMPRSLRDLTDSPVIDHRVFHPPQFGVPNLLNPPVDRLLLKPTLPNSLQVLKIPVIAGGTGVAESKIHLKALIGTSSPDTKISRLPSIPVDSSVRHKVKGFGNASTQNETSICEKSGSGKNLVITNENKIDSRLANNNKSLMGSVPSSSGVLLPFKKRSHTKSNLLDVVRRSSENHLINLESTQDISSPATGLNKNHTMTHLRTSSSIQSRESEKKERTNLLTMVRKKTMDLKLSLIHI
eukprot:TRINITY_DN8313_c0_g1_i1.p1 TRINITY_DN8313_c0_g1~~TRINITY_DN8313_c0_g1_i1.p1  ORF type:complete len:424 (+),score=15.05 TRINITY_DN8313_c0_g1_i1:618-1889(+)